MNLEIILIATFCLVAGMVATRQAVLRRHKKLLSNRLDSILSDTQGAFGDGSHTIVVTRRANDRGGVALQAAPNAVLTRLSQQSGLGWGANKVIILSIALALLPPAVGLWFQLHLLLCVAAGVVLAAVPVIVMVMKRAQMHRKFTEQLPDAIDLMISILRSGHSIPQSVKTVADEAANPCGSEFNEVLQRMNLGQPLPEALAYSVARFQSYELDLIRRAIAIQAEVGGSLAELLDKTNQTLRQRIKLARQVRVLTAQSRLTGVIVGLMPIVIAIAVQFLNPGYLNPLFDHWLGRALLVTAICLQALGIIIMKKMSAVKV